MYASSAICICPHTRGCTMPPCDALLKSASIANAVAWDGHEDNVIPRILHFKAIAKPCTRLPSANPWSIRPLAKQMHEPLTCIMLHRRPAPPHKKLPPRHQAEYVMCFVCASTSAQACQGCKSMKKTIVISTPRVTCDRQSGREPFAHSKHNCIHITLVARIGEPQRLPSQAESRSAAGGRFKRCGRILLAPSTQAWRSVQSLKMRCSGSASDRSPTATSKATE